MRTPFSRLQDAAMSTWKSSSGLGGEQRSRPLIFRFPNPDKLRRKAPYTRYTRGTNTRVILLSLISEARSEI